MTARGYYLEPLDSGRRLTSRLSSLLTEKEDEEEEEEEEGEVVVSWVSVIEENSFLSSLLTSSREEDNEDIVVASSSENIDIIDGSVVSSSLSSGPTFLSWKNTVFSFGAVMVEVSRFSFDNKVVSVHDSKSYNCSSGLIVTVKASSENCSKLSSSE